MEPVRREDRGAIALLTLSRPKQLNPLDSAALRALEACCLELSGEPGVRAVVLTGDGRAFAAGADIAEMRGHGPLEAEAFSRLGHRALAALEELSVPTIAAVNGYALGGGCELALACDWIYASTKARFGQPEVKLGLIPGFGGTSRLVRRVGVAWAKELVLGGEPVDAETALRIGLARSHRRARPPGRRRGEARDPGRAGRGSARGPSPGAGRLRYPGGHRRPRRGNRRLSREARPELPGTLTERRRRASERSPLRRVVLGPHGKPASSAARRRSEGAWTKSASVGSSPR
jgi:enoyl-CoA hydratase/carnithine racemase